MARKKKRLLHVHLRNAGLTSDKGSQFEVLTSVNLFLDCTQSIERRTAAATRIFGRIADDLLDRLLMLLGKGDEVEALNAAEAIAQVGSKTATLKLTKLLQPNFQEHNRWAALHALQRLRDRRSRRALIVVALDVRNSENLRAKAFDALASFAADRMVMRALLIGIQDASPNIRFYCIEALTPFIEDSRVLSAFKQLADDNATTWTGDSIKQAVNRLIKTDFP